MADIFEKWNKQIDAEAYKKEIEELEKNGGAREYAEVPYGLYEVEVEKLELRASKKGDPMVSCWFKIIAGQYEGQLIFMNQVVVQPFQIFNANEFLKQLDSGKDVTFTGNYADYNALLMDIKEAIDKDKLQYALNYSCNSKGFAQFEIEEVFEG